MPDALNPGQFYPPTAQHAIRQAAVLANNIVATMRGQVPQPFKLKIIGLLATIGRRHGVAEIFGWQFSGYLAWLLWRTIYLAKKVRGALVVKEPPGDKCSMRINIDNQESNEASRLRTPA